MRQGKRFTGRRRCRINTVNALGDNAISTGYGWEYDSLLTGNFGTNFTGFLKLTHVVSEGDV